MRALAPRRRLLPRFAGWLAATAAVAVLVVIAVPVLLSSPVPVARASSPGATQTPAPVLHISNETALQLTVVINGRVAEKAGPNSESIVDPTSFSAPWHVTVTTASGRELVQLTYGASDVWYTSNSAHGVAQRVDLSCGRLDVYAGPPLLGPGPPSSFPPHDCDEALPTISTNPTQPPP
ncbi:MAG TPA: hypothetical protein VIK00_00735, partial [Candidatus Limnocylindrales bacterium]